MSSTARGGSIGCGGSPERRKLLAVRQGAGTPPPPVLVDATPVPQVGFLGHVGPVLETLLPPGPQTGRKVTGPRGLGES